MLHGRIMMRICIRHIDHRVGVAASEEGMNRSHQAFSKDTNQSSLSAAPQSECHAQCELDIPLAPANSTFPNWGELTSMLAPRRSSPGSVRTAAPQLERIRKLISRRLCNC